jgi:hypothetical protein
VLCWSGQKKVVKDKEYFSRVDIELVNEQVRIFFSALDEVAITYDDDSFKIIEYVNLGLQNAFKFYPLEETVIRFGENVNYHIETTLVFQPPEFDKRILHHIYNSNNALVEKVIKGLTLTKNEIEDLNNLPPTYLICYLNLFHEAIDKLNEARPYLRNFSDELNTILKETYRILRKVKYS